MDETALEQTRLFRRQVLQLLPVQNLTWPSAEALRQADVQAFIYEQIFDEENNEYVPSQRYRLLVLKPLIARIEDSIKDPEEDVSRQHTVSPQDSDQEISDDLMTALATLMHSPLPSEADAALQKSWVTYTPIAQFSPPPHGEPFLRLKESRAVISGAGTTGLRTWEAALHLGSHLLSTPDIASSLVHGKHVVELGAGTGFLSILCAESLGAKQVTSTDGDEGVIEALEENIFFNDAGDRISGGVMRWGWTLSDSFVEAQCEQHGPVNTIIGADVTYDQAAIPALVATMRNAFERWPDAIVLLSATIRNEETFAAFESACEKNVFRTRQIEAPLIPMHEQMALFHSTDVPIRILEIKAPVTVRDPFAV